MTQVLKSEFVVEGRTLAKFSDYFLMRVRALAQLGTDAALRKSLAKHYGCDPTDVRLLAEEIGGEMNALFLVMTELALCENEDQRRRVAAISVLGSLPIKP